MWRILKRRRERGQKEGYRERPTEAHADGQCKADQERLQQVLLHGLAHSGRRGSGKRAQMP